MKILFKTFVFCLLTIPGFSQTQQENQPSFQDLFQELRKAMDQMGLGQSFQPGSGLSDFKWDTTFFLGPDSLNGGTWGSRFFFSPFGDDSLSMKDFWGDGSFFKNLEPFGDGFGLKFQPIPHMPENEENSAIDAPDDGLLPEERLRKQEEAGSRKPEKPADKQPAKKSNIKTIRI